MLIPQVQWTNSDSGLAVCRRMDPEPSWSWRRRQHYCTLETTSQWIFFRSDNCLATFGRSTVIMLILAVQPQYRVRRICTGRIRPLPDNHLCVAPGKEHPFKNQPL